MSSQVPTGEMIPLLEGGQRSHGSPGNIFNKSGHP